MENRLAVLSLFLVVIASGCINGGGNEPSKSIEASLELSSTQVIEGNALRVKLVAENTGNLPAKIAVGEKGKNIMTNYCENDLFTIDEYSLTTNGEREKTSVTLKPGREIRVNWRLKQVGTVELISLNCKLRFSLPFNYSVRSYRQIQIKKNRKVEGAPKLYAESSSGPMKFAIYTLPGLTHRNGVYIAQNGTSERTIGVRLQLINTEREGYGKGVIDVDEKSLAVKATPPLKLDEGFTSFGGSKADKWQAKGYKKRRCDLDADTNIRMFEGKSRLIPCEIPLPENSKLDSPAVTSEIRARVNYTYIKDLRNRVVTVEPGG